MSTTRRPAPTHIVLASALALVLCLASAPGAAQTPAAGQATRARVQIPTVPMPNLVGRSYQAALQDSVVTKFKIGLSAKETPSQARPGTIVGQEPAAGSPIRPGASATVFVATAPRQPPPPARGVRIPGGQIVDRATPIPIVRVPRVLGLPEGQATEALSSLNFEIVRQYASVNDQRSGTVIEQEPVAGTPVRPRSSVRITVARARPPDDVGPNRDPGPVSPPLPTEPALGRMPNLVGQTFDLAVRRSDVRELRLRLEQQPDRTAPGLPGTVLKQSVPPGTGVEIGRSVSVVVATGVAVPQVTRQPSALAERQIAAAGLRPAASSVLSDQEPGTVVTQTPAAGVVVSRGAAVAITVARARPRQPDDVVAPPRDPGPVVVPPREAGPAVPPTPTEPPLARMPDLVGRSFTLALQHPEVLGARLRLDQQFDATAAGLPGTIVRQSVPAGTGVEVGRNVAVLVATGVAVPLVMRQPSAVAERQVAAAGLRPTVSSVTSDQEAGTVVGQTPAAGVIVSRGAAVAIAVAVPAKVTVPDLVGRTRAEADQELSRLKLRAEAADDALSTAAPGRVATQQPQPGVEAIVGAAVRIGIATGVEVPSLRGLPADEAQRTVAQRGLSFEDIDVTTEQVPPGRVFSQQPQAGAVVARGSRVRVALAVPPAVEVPDVRGLVRAEAERALQARRLTAEFSDDNASTQAPDRVVTQAPAPGTSAGAGAVVRLTVATGVVVPDLVGQTRDRAVVVAEGAGLAVGLQSVADSAAVAGRIFRQEPAANTRVARGTAITLFLPLPQSTLIAVPNLVGLARVQAEAALTRLGLGARVTEADSAAQANTVVSQSPDPNVQVALGSQIALVVARQVAPIPTPAVPTPPQATAPVIPVWLTPLLVVVTLVGWQAWKFARSDRVPPRPPTEIHATMPHIDLEPQAGEHSLRLEVFGKSLVDLEVRVRATHDQGEQSLQVPGETLIADERRVYE